MSPSDTSERPTPGLPGEVIASARLEGTEDEAELVNRERSPTGPAVGGLWSERTAAGPRAYVVPVIVVALIGVVAMMNHFSGVDWGDDFALYMRQARSLTIGDIGDVIADNRFTVDNSGWHTFSPYVYPWGWPIIVAPFYAVWGLDYAVFKFLQVVALCVFLFLFYVLVRRRAGPVPAMILMLLIGLSPSFVGATDTVLSDLPYLCFVGLSLWWMDRLRVRGILEASRRHLITLGLLLAFTYNIRREGIALLAALVALHAAVAIRTVWHTHAFRAMGGIKAKNMVLPYTTFVGAVVGFQLLLPTVMFPSAPGAGLQNISARFAYNRDVLAEHVGLKDFGQVMQLFHSRSSASKAVTVLLVFALIGLVGRLVERREEDVTLAAYLFASSFMALVSPYQASRYLFTITPLLVYFAYQALPTMFGPPLAGGRNWLPVVSAVPALAFLGLVMLNASDLKRSTDYHRVYQYTVNGPEDVNSRHMLSAVRDLSRAQDVVLFFRARAMTLYTDRLAVQGSDLDLLLKRSDWYVMAKNSTYAQTLLTDVEGTARGLTKAWENDAWVIWRVPLPV